MPVQTTRISARYPVIENQTQNFHLAWDVTHFWFGFRRWIPWDKYSTTNHLFQRWSQETPLEEWGWDKNRKEASKECFTSCFCCGESEFYPAGELSCPYIWADISPKTGKKVGAFIHQFSFGHCLRAASKDNLQCLWIAHCVGQVGFHCEGENP